MTTYRDLTLSSTEDDRFQILRHRKSLNLQEDGDHVRALLRAIERSVGLYAPDGRVNLKVLVQERSDDRKIIKGASVSFAPEHANGRRVSLGVVLNGVSKPARTAFFGRAVAEEGALGLLGVLRPIANDVQARVRVRRARALDRKFYLELLNASAGEAPLLYISEDWETSNSGLVIPPAQSDSVEPVVPANDAYPAEPPPAAQPEIMRTMSAVLLSALATTMGEAANANSAGAEKALAPEPIFGEILAEEVPPTAATTGSLSPLNKNASLGSPMEFSRKEVKVGVAADLAPWLKTFVRSLNFSVHGTTERFRRGRQDNE